ncbi:MAG: 5-formyltetrahydrofolate cyclo-ligase [Clostridiales bacterium]|jgi:5-formyltetrahydrofolate cyclo-ligase|nr:5-formyltetrahydrofolate cyclo-ligase [Clostridiales bacterium]
MPVTDIRIGGKVPGLAQRKRELRRLCLERRKNRRTDDRSLLDGAIITRITGLACFRFANAVLLYMPTGTEIDVRPLITASLEAGKLTALPRCGDNHSMTFHIIESPDQLSAGAFGILEPDIDLPAYDPRNAEKDLALCVIPAVAWDKNGYRLGSGGGYYDRFLPGFAGARAGLAYEEDILDSLPRGRYDIRSDFIVTEKGVRTFSDG